MKRTLAMLFALIITLSLCVLTGCKEAKNYTVKEVDGKKRIFLNQNEVTRIWEEVQTQGYSLTRLEGFCEKDLNPTDSVMYLEEPVGEAESSVFEFADLIIKCKQVGDPETYRIDAAQKSQYQSFYGEVYNLKVEQVFYTSEDINPGDIIRVMFHRWQAGDRYKNLEELKNCRGIVEGVSLNDRTSWDAPVKDKSMYIFLCAYPMFDKSYLTYNFTKLADYSSCYGIPLMIEESKNTYLVYSIFESLLEGAKKIPEENRTRSLNMYLETNDFDLRFQNMVDKYDDVVRISKR